jgi:hypothetical protein
MLGREAVHFNGEVFRFDLQQPEEKGFDMRESLDQGEVRRGTEVVGRSVAGDDFGEAGGVDGEVAERGDGVFGTEAVTEAVAGGFGFAGGGDWSTGFGAVEAGGLDLFFGTHVCAIWLSHADMGVDGDFGGNLLIIGEI